MSDPSIPASHRDLLESADPVALATVGPTGHPQVTAIWAILDGDQIVTSLTAHEPAVRVRQPTVGPAGREVRVPGAHHRRDVPDGRPPWR